VVERSAQHVGYFLGRGVEFQLNQVGGARSTGIDCPLDFIARLATLVPKPRVNLTRFHGVFTPNSNTASG